MEHNLTLKQQFANIGRGLKIITNLPKPAMLSNAVSILVDVPIPFANLWFSARLLNELAGARDRGNLIFLAAMLIGINLVTRLIGSAVNRWAAYCNSQNQVVMENILCNKMFDVDFTDLENPEFQLEYSTLREHLQGMGYGLQSLFNTTTQLIRGGLRVGLSVAFAFTMFAYPVPQDSPLAWLSSPWAIAVILLLLACSSILVPYLHTRGGKVWVKAADVNNTENRFANFYLWTMICFGWLAKDIRIYDQQRMISKTADAALLDVNKWKKFYTYQATHSTASDVLAQGISGVIYLYVAVKAFAGAFGVGHIVQYVGAINQFTNGFGGLMHQVGELYNNGPFLARCLNFLDTPGKIYQGTIPVEKRDDCDYEIEFKNVSFKYPGGENFAIKNLNLKLQTGQRLAVVGMNGSGKSTMIKLLTRLYDPTEGIITLNGIDIKKYNYMEYLGIFGVVFQDHGILNFTLGENVAASMRYDEELVINALVQAGFDKRLETMPHGLNTYIGKWFSEEGIDISGGESQKIVLARALYKNAPFIILDEPTAALDPIAEYEIYTKFNDIVGNKTAVYISHRLSSCRFCDDIIVFHEGELIQQGSHEDLMRREGEKYFELWNAQAQYYA
ncbi:MAG: ABC transporter ATP-binding protein/permease [Defluviitaleaceae bacterium]|nr:ABC transporter ATP-binding protein/permease [Defluviitaleaceae bacterium]